MFTTKSEHISTVTSGIILKKLQVLTYNIYTENKERKDKILQKFTMAELLEQKFTIQLPPLALR